MARESSPIGPSPFLPIGWFYTLDQINLWISSLKTEYWTSQPGLAQSKRLINLKLHKNAPLGNRNHLRLYVGFLTGHYPTRSYLYKIGVIANPTCRLCGAIEETTEHILMKCPRLFKLRMLFLHKPFLEANNIKSSKARDIVNYLKEAVKILES